MKLINKGVYIFDRTNEYLFTLSGILILTMFIIMLVDVGARLMKIPLMGGLSVIEYGLLFFTFLGAAHLLKTDGHIRMDLLINTVEPGNRHLINASTHSIAALLWLTVTLYSAYSVVDAIQLNLVPSSILRVPRAPILAVIPFGSLLLFIQSVRKTIGYVQSFKRQKRALASDE